MPLHAPPAPPEAVARIRQALARLWARGEKGPPEVREHPLPRLSLSAPHPVHDLSLQDVAEGRGLEAARLSGLRVLVLDADRAVAAVELPTAGQGVHIQLGDLPHASALAIRAAEVLEAVLPLDLELRLLRVSALYLLAIWAHGERDILVPLLPAPAGLVAGRPYPPDELLAALREPAQRKQRFRYHP